MSRSFMSVFLTSCGMVRGSVNLSLWVTGAAEGRGLIVVSI